MLQWFRRRGEASRKAEELYGAVVTAARQPAFYRDMGVPDTPEGRFELVALHLFLLLEDISGRDRTDPEIVRRTIEAFVTDMDDCMREMGVGDMAVGKKVKRAAAAFYERAAAYRDALAGGDGVLQERLETYVLGGGATGPNGAASDGIQRLARYVRAAVALCREEPFDRLVAAGKLEQLLSQERIYDRE